MKNSSAGSKHSDTSEGGGGSNSDCIGMSFSHPLNAHTQKSNVEICSAFLIFKLCSTCTYYIPKKWISTIPAQQAAWRID